MISCGFRKLEAEQHQLQQPQQLPLPQPQLLQQPPPLLLQQPHHHPLHLLNSFKLRTSLEATVNSNLFHNSSNNNSNQDNLEIDSLSRLLIKVFNNFNKY